MELLNSATLRASWHNWCSTGWTRDGPAPRWLRLAWTFLFSAAVALGITALSWTFSRRFDLGAALRFNFVLSQCVGFTIHFLFWLALRLLGAPRIESLRPLPRAFFYAGIPITGVLIGYSAGLALMGVDVPKLAVQRPQIFVGVVVFSIALSALWYSRMANKARLAEAEAEQARERARATELERQAVVARLQALQAQVEPHFLFNTLANVLSLIDSDPTRARCMLERLIDLLRSSLSASRAQNTTLAREVDVVRAYLEILKLRMGNRLQTSVDVPAAASNALLPPLMLQPLVENAIRHGLEPKVEGGRVQVSARVLDDRLTVEVEDDGLGFTPQENAGVGLDNVRSRLRARYGDSARLVIEDSRPGTRVRITLPLELA